MTSDFGETDEYEEIDDEDDNICPPNPAVLLPRLGKSISGNNFFLAGEEERAPARGGIHSNTGSARTASTEGVSHSDLGESISGNNSFQADKEERASARGGSCSATESARTASTQGVSRSDTASSCGGNITASARGGRKGKAGSVAHSKEGAGGGKKKSRALTQPFTTPRKSPDKNLDNDEEESGFTFQNMMGMMMMQSPTESE